jgi:hypothetical protein
MDRSDANRAVNQMNPGGFIVVHMPNPKLFLLVIKTDNGCYEASIVKSAQGCGTNNLLPPTTSINLLEEKKITPMSLFLWRGRVLVSVQTAPCRACFSDHTSHHSRT